MRISRLDLHRYGKFTDKSLSLPCSGHDFHLLVGPNEVGKSTTRDAILDLLFGIGTRSRYNFIHPHSEMRLGALIEQGTEELDFIRTKARAKTLQTAAGTLLPDNALTPFLGQVDRAFYDQMFGLNHERLVSGGEEILSASNDIGQILFQAAAGVASLGEIRARLDAEADKLWAKRKSGEREYYIASAELEQAEAALKLATVRTRDWQEARSGVDRIGADLDLARQHYRALEEERVRLERVRRAAPMLTAIAQLEREAAELGEVVSLPENAAAHLTKAEHEIAIATSSLLPFEKRAEELQEKIATLHPDQSILARGADIEALSGMRQQLRNHEIDIGKREEEIRVLWQDVEEAMRQLEWPEQGEEAVARRLPGSLVRAALDNLVHRHGALAQALATAQEALASREAEAKTLHAEMLALPAGEVPVTLTDALTTARSLGDVAVQMKRNEALLLRLEREREVAALELGAWNPATDKLRKLFPPSQDETNDLIQRRSGLEQGASMTRERLAEDSARALSLQLEIAQYKAIHHPVTLADVQQVRSARDSAWQAIRRGALDLQASAPDYEMKVSESDQLSDQRHDKAQEESELQSRLDRLQGLQLHLADLEARLRENAGALAGLDRSWEARIASIGLAGMPLLQANDWRAARERVLAAADTLADAHCAQADLAAQVAQARAALTQAMPDCEPQALDLKLSALILLAEEKVNAATRVQERRNTIDGQKIRAEAALPALHNRVLQAQSAMETWHAEMQKNLALAHLAPDADMGTIDGALALFERMDQHLRKIREIRVNRIDTMRRDLQDFADSAASLAQEIAPEMAREPAAQIASSLDSRLKLASSAAQELARLQAERENTLQQANAAAERIAEASAGLEPLLRLARAPNNDALRAAIGRSDRQRALSSDIGQAIRQLLQAGDGLSRAALESEFGAVDVPAIAIRLAEIKQQSDDIVGLQNRLSGELNSAESALGKIAGQDEAARAESQRQEALARMSNAADRYIKVFTAAKLLRWAIERFRERKQGPMLARAGEIFCGLTRGSFHKLSVDFDIEPLKLAGQRASGECVDIEGMSEGTRDQLYLALRLAALELHLAQTPALPFIADDLFINYDDGRARAGFEALAHLSGLTQVIFLTHHEHLVSVAQAVFGEKLNVVTLA